MKTRKNLCRAVLFSALLSVLFFISDDQAHAYNSKAWKERLSARTATLWIEGEPLGDGIVLNARGELNVTWLESGLARILDTDNYVDEWVLNGLNYYFSNRKETRDKMKGRDVLALRYRAIKNWSFDPEKLTINDYAITSENILTKKEYWESELVQGYVGMVVVATPSLKPGQTMKLRYEDAEAQIELPRTRSK